MRLHLATYQAGRCYPRLLPSAGLASQLTAILPATSVALLPQPAWLCLPGQSVLADAATRGAQLHVCPLQETCIQPEARARSCPLPLLITEGCAGSATCASWSGLACIARQPAADPLPLLATEGWGRWVLLTSCPICAILSTLT